MNLEEMKEQVGRLVEKKGFFNSEEYVPHKLLFAMIELAEAANAWKKGKGTHEVAEELIDVVFYIVDAARLACPNVNLDEAFKNKLEKNLRRRKKYGEKFRRIDVCQVRLV